MLAGNLACASKRQNVMNATTRIPSSQEIVARQKANADRQRAETAQKRAVAAPKTTAVAPVPDGRTPQQQYLEAIASPTDAYRRIRFTRDGEYVTADDEPINKDAVFIAHCDQTLIGWQRFHEGAPPERAMGLLYEQFVMPSRDELDDPYPANWQIGLSGEPEDPWQHTTILVLEHA